jgi:hypothetical protein
LFEASGDATMKRCLFNLLAGLSLLLCVGSVALWVHCSSRLEMFAWRASRWDIDLIAAEHEMVLAIGFFDTPSAVSGQGWSRDTIDSLETTYLRNLTPHSIGGAGISLGYGAGSLSVLMPSWLVVAAALGFAVYFRHRAKRSSRAPGVCTTCGYDLRATPDRCPECATIPERATA